MRILQLIPELNEGGVERGVIETNREFTRLGHDSHVASAGGSLVHSLSSHKGTHHNLNLCSKNIITAPQRIGKLRKLIDAIDPCVIHARSRVPAWLAHFANGKNKRPLVTTVHGLNSVNRYSKIMTSGDRVICVSEVIKDHIIQHYKTDPHKIRVIQRGVDMDYFNPESVSEDRIQSLKHKFSLQNQKIITSIGRITWLKDYETFIQSIAKISQSHPDVVGLIVGGYRSDKSDYFNSLQKLARSCGIAERIVFTGSQHDMPAIYAMSDLVVNISLKMGNMGRTAVEALALGTPLIATTYKGLTNLVREGENGYIVNTKDPEGLAEAMLQALDHTYSIESIRRSIPHEYTLEHMIKSILGVYSEIA